ncbi:MAG: tape measure protein [Bifidobacterium sp.]|jgi:tape measure domain-containing protein
MAQDIGTVYVQVKPSGKDFGKTLEGQIAPSIDKAGAKGSTSLTSRLGKAFGAIGKIGLGAVTTITGGIVALAAKGGFTRALNIENAKAKLKGLGHDSASVAEIMNDALASVKGTAFGLGDAATVAASLSASGVKQGSQLTKVLKTVGDTAQISGRSLTDIGTIFGSVAARGKLQGDDMLQLMSSGIPVLQMLGKHLGKTSGEVSAMVSKGQIDFQTFADAMQEGMGGAALSAGTTFTGALANVKAALSRLGEQAATPILDGLRGLFNQAIPLIDGFTAAATPVMQQVGAGLQSGLESAIPTVQEFFTQLSQNSIVTALGGALQSLGSMAGETFGQIEYLMSGVTADSSVAAAFGRTVDGLSSVISHFSGLIDSATTAVGNFILGFSDAGALQPLLNAIGDIVGRATDLVSGVIGATTGILDFANTSGIAYGAGETFASMLDVLASALEFVSRNMDWIKPLASGIGGIVLASKGLGAVTSGLGSLAQGANGVAAAATGISKWIDLTIQLGGMPAAFKQMASGMEIIKNAQLAWSAVTKAATAIQIAFQAVMATSLGPITLIVGALAAVTAAAAWFFTQTEVGRKAWASFTGWLAGVWAATASIAVGIWNGLGSFFSNLWSRIVGTVKAAASAISAFLHSAFGQAILAVFAPFIGIPNLIVQNWGRIGSFFSTLWDGVKSAASALGGFFSGVWSAISSAFLAGVAGIGRIMAGIVTVIGAIPVWLGQQLLSGINALFGAIVNLLTGWASNSTGIVHTLLEGIISYITTVWNILSSIVSTGVNLIRTIIVTIVDLLQGDWQGAWNTISGFLIDTWNTITTFLSPALAAISSEWSAVWGTVSAFFSAVWSGIVAVASSMGSALYGAISAVMSAIGGAWDSAWSAVSAFFSAVWNGIVGFAGPVLAALSGAIGGAVSAIGGAWNAAWSAIRGFFSAVWNGMISVASSAVNAIGGVVGRIRGTVLGALSGAGQWLSSVGRNIVSGLIGGITGAFGWLKDTITNLGNNALSWAKSVLHIHSPSRVFRDQVGFMIGAGMALGIDDSGTVVERSLRSMNLKLQDGIDPVGVTLRTGAGVPIDTARPEKEGTTVNQYIYPQQDDPRIQMRMWGREASRAMAGTV